MSKKISWGIIGAGDVCEVKSAPAMQLIQDSEIVAIMRRNAAKAESYAKRHGIEAWYTDAQQLIDDPSVNAIYIATPPAYHMEYTLLAAKAGKPVYVEKPMAISFKQCTKMIEACDKAKIPLFVAYYRRALPHFNKVKDLIEEGHIGDVRLVQIELYQAIGPNLASVNTQNWRVNPEIAGGGYFYDLASHQLDLLDYLLGPIVSAKGYARNQAGAYQAEDIVTGSLEFDCGAMGNGSWCFTTSPKSEKDLITIIGSKGEIRFSTFGAPEVTIISDSKASETFHFDVPKHIQHPLIKQVVGSLITSSVCVSTGESAARTNQVMEWFFD